MGRLLSPLVADGYYLAVTVSAPIVDLGLTNYFRRDTITNYVSFLRYVQMEQDSVTIFFDNCGDFLILHKIPPSPDGYGGLEYYTNKELRDPIYRYCLKIFADITGVSRDESDELFVLHMGAPSPIVTWNEVDLPSGAAEQWRFAIFIEAVFVSARSRISGRSLARLGQAKATDTTRAIVECAADLVFAEKPEHFLVNKREIEFMRSFYESWRIEAAVHSLQASFGLVLDAYNLHYNRIQTHKSDVLNRLAVGGTILALLAIVDTVHKVFTGLSEVDLSVPIVIVAFILFGIGIFAELSFGYKGWIESNRSKAIRKTILDSFQKRRH